MPNQSFLLLINMRASEIICRLDQFLKNTLENGKRYMFLFILGSLINSVRADISNSTVLVLSSLDVTVALISFLINYRYHNRFRKYILIMLAVIGVVSNSYQTFYPLVFPVSYSPVFYMITSSILWIIGISISLISGLEMEDCIAISFAVFHCLNSARLFYFFKDSDYNSLFVMSLVSWIASVLSLSIRYINFEVITIIISNALLLKSLWNDPVFRPLFFAFLVTTIFLFLFPRRNGDHHLPSGINNFLTALVLSFMAGYCCDLISLIGFSFFPVFLPLMEEMYGPRILNLSPRDRSSTLLF